jgi:hypothetical protein
VLYVLTRGRCGTWPLLAAPPPQYATPSTVVERIIFSPEAAEGRFGVHGAVIIERETRKEG